LALNGHRNELIATITHDLLVKIVANSCSYQFKMTNTKTWKVVWYEVELTIKFV